MTCCNVLYIPPGIILSKKCSTAQSFICKAVTSYKIHTLVYAKGQLISKRTFGVFKSTKKQQRKFCKDFCLAKSKNTIF